MLKLAIIGVGGLGKVHLRNIIDLEKTRGDIKLVALCDVDQSRFAEETKTNLGGDTAPIDLSPYTLYTDADELLEKEQLDFVITALPTYIHEKMAVKALEKGLHVFSEKPMARSLEQCQNMIDKAKENKRLLMIGQCLRYWPEYVKLKEYIDGGELGKVIRAEFLRYSLTPTWTWQNWMMDYEKCGGAALDMHVHDVDFINWAFGKPEYLTSAATHAKTKFESMFTTYYYKDKLVTSSCDWGLSDSYPFKPAFLVNFEKATVEMGDNGLTVFPNTGEPYKPEIEESSAYVNEIIDLIECIKANREIVINNPESSMQSIEMALAEVKSAESGTPYRF